MSAGKVSGVLESMVAMVSHGGTFARREIVPHWNTPRGTGLIANRAGIKTATAGRSLDLLESEGLVEFVGTGEQHCNTINKSAAQLAERYWKLTDAALAQVQP